MRRLPVYFLIDVSESMVGEPIEQVQDGIASIITALKTDPYALETVWVSIIGFAGKSNVITPLQDIITFYPPRIPVGSGTSLASGLTALMAALEKEIVKTTHDRKGDWKPIIFLFTDGVPTDDTEQAVHQWNTGYRNKSSLIAISIGENTNFQLLGKISDNVLQFNDTGTAAYGEFFKWVTASIKATSENIHQTHSDGINLGMANPEIIERVDTTKPRPVPDDNYVVLNGKCSQNKRQYVVKFKQFTEDSGILNIPTRIYRVQGAFKIDENAYKAFSAESDVSIKIAADELYGNPPCPCCGNPLALASCSCGGIHCIQDNGANTCPWCGNTGFYGHTEGGFNINRTLG